MCVLQAISIMMRDSNMLKGLNLVLLFGLANALTYSIDIESGPIATVSESFLSITLDTTNISTIDLSHRNLVKLTKQLSPLYIRIGGTEADDFFFEDDLKTVNSNTAYGSGVLQGSYWLKIYEFAENVNARILYDLNSLQRNDDGSWNSDNAEQMIKFSKKNGLDLDWEIGNEPDLYHAIFQKYVEASQLGNDIIKLRTLLDQNGCNSSNVFGPSMFDVGSSSDTQTYLKDYLSIASPTLRAVTWHHYYFNGRQATVDWYLNPDTFYNFEQRAGVVAGIVGSSNKIWLDETSSGYQGGTPDVANRFVAGFLWLDKLGVSATNGFEVVARQSIWGNNYSLLDSDYNVTPDWWLSVLYKKLVGTKVVSITNDGEYARTVRLYAHCANQNSLWDETAVVVFGLNFANSTGTFSLTGLKTSSPVYVYELTPESSLLSQTVRLNGNILSLSDDADLPSLEPKTIDPSDSYTMPAYSIVFWVFTASNVKACQ